MKVFSHFLGFLAMSIILSACCKSVWPTAYVKMEYPNATEAINPFVLKTAENDLSQVMDTLNFLPSADTLAFHLDLEEQDFRTYSIGNVL